MKTRLRIRLLNFNCKTKTMVNSNDIARVVGESQAEIIQRIGQWMDH